MSRAEIVMTLLLLVIFALVCYATNQRLDRILAEEHARTLMDALLDISAGHQEQPTNWDRHVDQALEQAEPTPDLRRVR